MLTSDPLMWNLAKMGNKYLLIPTANLIHNSVLIWNFTVNNYHKFDISYLKTSRAFDVLIHSGKPNSVG